MSAPVGTALRIESAVAALGSGPLTEERPAAARGAAVLARARRVARSHLSRQSLARPPARRDGGRRARRPRRVVRASWAARGTRGSPRCARYRGRLARAARARRVPIASCPKTSAGQGLRAILNTYDAVPRVVATRGEFDSLDVILREYARRGRIALTLVEPRADGHFATRRHRARRSARAVDLVVVSQVMFNTGQWLADLPAIVAAAARGRRARPARRLPLARRATRSTCAALDVDFAVGGAYKYLRGGPGACFLYLHPRHLDGGLRTLDTGWFAKRDPFAYLRPDPPELRARRRRVSRIDAAGAAALPGARRAGAHAGDRRRAAARVLAGAATQAGGVAGRARHRGHGRHARTAARSSWSTRRSDARRGVDARGAACERRGVVDRRARRAALAAVPGRPDHRRRDLWSAAARGGRDRARTYATPRRADDEAHDDDQRHDEHRRQHDADQDDLMRPDRHGVLAHRRALADAEEAREHGRARSTSRSGRAGRGRRMVGMAWESTHACEKRSTCNGDAPR